MFKTPARQHEKDLNGPLIVTLGLFGQNPEESVLMAASAEKVDNYTGNTINNNNSMAIYSRWTAEHPITTSTTLPG